MIIEQEVVEATGEIIPVPQTAIATANLFGESDPDAIIRHASAHASALNSVVTSRHLTKRIGDKDYMLVEGWTLLGSMVGVFPVCVWTHQLDNGWEARVEAHTRQGEVIGAAEAMCTRDEKTWAKREDYALRSMAQTRATSKALRMPLGFICTLAGYEATPADEMPDPPSGVSERGSSAPAPSTARAHTTPLGVKCPLCKEGELQRKQGEANGKPYDFVGCSKYAKTGGCKFNDKDVAAWLDIDADDVDPEEIPF